METKRNFSKKRQAILETLRNTKEHPSAEWIYNRLKPDYPDLSLGTVYRNLAMFREEGEIISVGTVDGQERFDADLSEHAHFVCTRCDTVADVPEPDVGKLCRLAAESVGGEVSTHRLTFIGVCGKCLAADKKTSAGQDAPAES